ncbi:MAG: hypothetical protein Q4G09_06175 [Clostridia bacterium]|nr:hypothetical protein [Clostridia bacterium]
MLLDNRTKSANFKDYKSIYIARIYTILETKSFVPSNYNVFTIHEPKERK